MQHDFYDAFEDVLARRIDTGEMPGRFDKIEQGDAFRTSGEDLGVVLFYMALQLTRTPAFWALSDDMWRKNLVEWRSVQENSPVRPVLDAELPLERDCRDKVAMMLRAASAVAKQFCVMNKWVVRAPRDSFFLTSDCPVAVGPFLDGHTRAGGLRDDAVAFALSPRTALLMCRHLPDNRYVQASVPDDIPKVAGIVARMNRLITRRCRRWLYSDRESAPSELGLRFPLERFTTISQRLAPGLVRTFDVLTTAGAV